MQDHIKDPDKINMYGIHFSSIQRKARNLIMKGKEIGQTFHALANSLISVPNYNLHGPASRWILFLAFSGVFISHHQADDPPNSPSCCSQKWS